MLGRGSHPGALLLGAQDLRREPRLELLQLLGAGQGLQEAVLTLQLGVFLQQFFNLLLQDLYFLPHRIHQVIFHQILQKAMEEIDYFKVTPWGLLLSSCQALNKCHFSQGLLTPPHPSQGWMLTHCSLHSNQHPGTPPFCCI